METKQIRLSIESKYDNVPLVGCAINRLCASIPVSDRDAYIIELCVTEAVVNSIKHGYGDEPGNEVAVIFSVYDTKIVIEIIDSGKALDPVLLEEKRESGLEFDPENIDAIPESGRGLAIMHAVMDDVSYHVRGNRKYLTLTKEIHSP